MPDSTSSQPFNEEQLFYLGRCNLIDKQPVIGCKSYPDIEYSWFIDKARVEVIFSKSPKYGWYKLSISAIWDNRYQGENRTLFEAAQTFDDDSTEWFILMGGWMHQTYNRVKAHKYREDLKSVNSGNG